MPSAILAPTATFFFSTGTWALNALEAAGTNTGRLKELIRLTDAPPEYLAVAADHETIALGEGAFSSHAELVDTLRHELVHLDQHAAGQLGDISSQKVLELESGANARPRVSKQ